MNECIESIKNMTQKGLKIDEIVCLSGLSISKIRKILLENDIYPSKNDKEYRHFNDAKLLKKHAKNTYFYTDLAKKTGISPKRVRFLAEIYSIKLHKKSFCVVCGAELDILDSKIVTKYCSRKCCDKNNRPKRDKKTIIKTCKYCAKTFEGKPNSKYCSDLCKKLYNEVEDTVRWLRG